MWRFSAPVVQLALFFLKRFGYGSPPQRSIVGWKAQVRAASAWRPAASRRGDAVRLVGVQSSEAFRGLGTEADALIRRRRGVRLARVKAAKSQGVGRWRVRVVRGCPESCGRR